ncbi:hypothetical protein TNCV_4463341 [Trichonephila clavipes]|nr:hypothetical protein TNCV_4463341 [Trichonephila clavipes]
MLRRHSCWNHSYALFDDRFDELPNQTRHHDCSIQQNETKTETMSVNHGSIPIKPLTRPCEKKFRFSSYLKKDFLRSPAHKLRRTKQHKYSVFLDVTVYFSTYTCGLASLYYLQMWQFFHFVNVAIQPEVVLHR